MTLTFPTISLSSLIAQGRHAARSHPLSHPEPQPHSFTDADQARRGSGPTRIRPVRIARS